MRQEAASARFSLCQPESPPAPHTNSLSDDSHTHHTLARSVCACALRLATEREPERLARLRACTAEACARPPSRVGL